MIHTIETTITVLPDGSIQIASQPDLAPGQYRAVLMPQTPANEREYATAALRAAGLLAEPSAEMQRLAAESTLTLAEARATLDRAGGTPLSELILEMRGSKG